MHALLMSLALAAGADAPECRNPPSRSSDAYWSFIEACGCERLEAPSAASEDHERYLSACSAWRQRNPPTDVVVTEATPVSSGQAAGEVKREEPSECRNPPSRASSAYWSFIDACGCANLEAPSRASADHDRYLKACSDWRQRNPRIDVIVPARPTHTARPAAAPTPTPSPKAGGR